MFHAPTDRDCREGLVFRGFLGVGWILIKLGAWCFWERFVLMFKIGKRVAASVAALAVVTGGG